MRSLQNVKQNPFDPLPTYAILVDEVEANGEDLLSGWFPLHVQKEILHILGLGLGLELLPECLTGDF